MEKIQLGELCDKGSSNLAQKNLVFNSGEFPIYGASGEITRVDFYHQSKPYLGIIKDGAGVGRVMKLPGQSSIIGTMQYIYPGDTVDINYLFYLLRYLDLGKSNTGATIPHIYFKDYKKRLVNKKDIDEQIKIGNILSKIESQLNDKKKLLEQYDLLIKSRFVDLFGDIIVNSKTWPVVKLKDIASYRIGLTYKPEDICMDGVPVFRSGNIQNSTLVEENLVYVKKEVSENLLLKRNDILMCARNGSKNLVGKVALINISENYKITYGAFMMGIRSEFYAYLIEYFKSPAFRRYVTAGETTTINQITTRMLNSISLPLPDKSLIIQFENYCNQINKLKFAIMVYN